MWQWQQLFWKDNKVQSSKLESLKFAKWMLPLSLLKGVNS
jgi:hypothetical protein